MKRISAQNRLIFEKEVTNEAYWRPKTADFEKEVTNTVWSQPDTFEF